MKVLTIIPARGGSKGVKNKNTKPLLGKPLICYTIDAALESKLTDKIVVSTNSDLIAKTCENYGVQTIKRPLEFSTDSAPIELALRHAVKYIEQNENFSPDIVVWLQANVPIRKKRQIDDVIQKLIDTKADSVITVTKVSQNPDLMKKMVDDNRLIALTKTKKYRRQEFDDLYIADGAVTAMKKDVLMKTEGMTGAHIFLGEDMRGVVEETKYAIEIDEPFDFDVAEGLLLLDEARETNIH